MKIEARNISKKYGSVLALDNLTCSFENGKIYGLLGRNGAGKTSLLNILTNKIYPNEGEVFLDGVNILKKGACLNHIYYMTEQDFYPANMKVKKLFYWTAQFYKNFSLAYAQNLAQAFGLSLEKKVKSLSTGYGTILKGILTLASGAPFMFFDEPILGLDAYHRDLFYKELVNNFAEEGKTILLSSHLIDEIADIVEEVLILKEGRVLLNMPVEDVLARSYRLSGLTENVDKYLQDKDCLKEEQLKNFKSVTIFADYYDQALTKSLNLEVSKPELQELFVALTSP